MTQPKESDPALPGLFGIEEKVLVAIQDGTIKLPMEDRITAGQLIRAKSGFERAEHMQSVETEIITHMAIGKIYGKDTKGYFPPLWDSDPDATAGKHIEQEVAKLAGDHESLGLIHGDLSKKRYIAELDQAAQQFVEQVYPGLVQVEKGGK